MYYVFAGDNYYPGGGVYDFRGRALTIDDAQYILAAFRDRQRVDWWHITDDTMEIVAHG